MGQQAGKPHVLASALASFLAVTNRTYEFSDVVDQYTMGKFLASVSQNEVNIIITMVYRLSSSDQ